MRWSTVEEIVRAVLGMDFNADELGWGQAAARAVVMYLAVLVMVRLGKKRFLGRGTVFDVVVGIVIGSIAARTMTGGARLSVGIAAVAVTIALHWLLSGLAVRWRGFGALVKGNSRVLIRDGEVDEREMRRVHLTHADLEEELRIKGRDEVAGIREARLERDGSVSVLAGKPPPKMVEVKVEPGVQTVRIELG